MLNNFSANIKHKIKMAPHLLSQCIFQLLLWKIQLRILYFTEKKCFYLGTVIVYNAHILHTDKFLIEYPVFTQKCVTLWQ